MAHKNKSNWSPYKARQKNNNSNTPAAGDNPGGGKLNGGKLSGVKSAGNKTSGDKSANVTSGGVKTSGNKSASFTTSGNARNSSNGRHKQPDPIFSLEEANDRLYDLFDKHGFEKFPHDKRRKLAEFYLLLMETQKTENFTRLLNLRDVGIKHFVDSMIVANLTQLQFPLMDVGTGPGFPGIPLKILFPQEQILLAEGVQRRVEFLKGVREKLALENLLILGRNINTECFYPVNGVITRAVEDIRNTLGNVINTLQTGGCVYFMKGPGVDPELQVAKETWSEYYELIQDTAYTLPNTPHERRLLVYKKIKTHEVSDEFLESLGLQDEDGNNEG